MIESYSVLPIFSSKSFIASDLKFRTLTHLSLFVCGVMNCPNIQHSQNL